MLHLFSPAKVNLFLRIVSKRSDGYHNLSSIFQTISLGDALTMELSAREELTCTDLGLPTDRSNLILKATELFRHKTGLNQAFRIHLIKRIPTQAGLGGGSSNAATTLWGCNQLTQANIPLDILQQWSAEIGSDIPFFFSQGTAHCTGRGEYVKDLPFIPPRQFWIIKPPEGLSTPEVYRCLNFTSSVSEKSLQIDLDSCLSDACLYFNDLEKPAFEMLPKLKQLKTRLLENGFEIALMSGSGTAFLCMGEGTLPIDPELNVFPVHFKNRSLRNWY
jgi:4-diphosphocytidyl-2-C-methyl-D-erythritol kinase